MTRLSEVISALGQRALGEGEHPVRSDPEDYHRAAVLVVEQAILDCEVPVAVVLGAPQSARVRSLESRMRTAVPSTTTSSPSFQRLQPVVRATRGFRAMFTRLLLRPAGEEVEFVVPRDRRQRRDVRPAIAQTVEIQKSSAVSSTRRTSAHGVAAASGLAKRISCSATGPMQPTTFIQARTHR